MAEDEGSGRLLVFGGIDADRGQVKGFLEHRFETGPIGFVGFGQGSIEIVDDEIQGVTPQNSKVRLIKPAKW
jgi:hypothetical protein